MLNNGTLVVFFDLNKVMPEFYWLQYYRFISVVDLLSQTIRMLNV